MNVDSVSVTVAFYDIDGNLLYQKSNFFIGYGKIVSDNFFIEGEVDSYEIISYTATYSSDVIIILVPVFIYFDIVIFAFLISSLLLSYKNYQYAGNEIIVYAGWYHHYIKINGTKVDEHNTIMNFTAISLSTTLDDSTKLVATISLTNRIALKINDKLYLGGK